MSQMSTPISSIPVPSSGEVPHEEDPEVMAILQEMQPASAPAPMAPPPVPRMPMMAQAHGYAQHAPPPTAQVVTGQSQKALFDQKKAQRAVYASLIAFLLFYPTTFAMLYQKVPKLQVLENYESVIRLVLLAGVLYLLMWKFDI